MSRPRSSVLGVLATFLATLSWPGLAAAHASDATPPRGRPPVGEGQPGRLTLGGRWLYRSDGAGVGVRRGFISRRSRRGWKPVSLPNDWNAREARTNRSSVGWYRRDFTLPRAAPDTRWIVRFEGAGHYATVYLNGRVIARHAGDYVPFEADLTGLRPGRNRLAVRISSRRARSDLTHWRPMRSGGYGNGMWWNFGGIHREVSVRPVRGLDIVRAQALPRLACPGCPATVQVRTLVHNLGPRTTEARVSLQADGRSFELPASRSRPGARSSVSSRSPDRGCGTSVAATSTGSTLGSRAAPERWRATAPGSASGTCASWPTAGCSSTGGGFAWAA